jgi:hypothetical protein
MRLMLLVLTSISMISSIQTVNNHKQSGRSDGSTTQENPNPQKPATASTPQFTAVHAGEETDRNQHAAEEQATVFGFTRFELTMAVLTLIYVGLTGFYAVTSHKTLNKIEEQIEIADRAAEAAEDAANRTRQLERPWIILRWGKVYDTRYTIGLKNCGRTVARIISAHSFVEVKNSVADLQGRPYYGIDGDFRDIILGPDDTKHCEDFDIVLVASKDGGNWDDVRDGRKVILYWGCIRYEDADRNSHETRFCYRYDNPSMDFVLCGSREYNKFT